MPKLLIKKNNALIKKISVPTDILAFTVGSEQGNDIIIQDESISYFHLQFEKQDDDYFVRDLQSQWGTFVNGRKISNRTILIDQDEIGIGTHNITFLNAKAETEKALVAENHESGQFAGETKLEERIAGIPTLNRLNSWIHSEEFKMEKQGDFYIDQNNGDEFTESLSETDEILQSTQPDPSFNLLNHNPNGPNHEPNEFVDVRDNGPKESPPPQLDFSPEPKFEAPPLKTPTLEFEDDFKVKLEEPIQKARAVNNYFLLGIYGYYTGRVFRLKHPETKIGRDRKLNDIVIKKNSKGKIDQSVSRRQATILSKDNRFYITDKRSKSRTAVNQQKLDFNDEIEINPGDEIEIISDRKSHILRLVQKEEWDFSFPKKAGSWHLRHRVKILNFYSLLLLLIAGFFVAKSMNTLNKILSKPDPFSVSESLWYTGEIDLAVNPSSTAQLQNYLAIADFNGDRTLDLVYIDENEHLICINGKSKQPLWQISEFKTFSDYSITIEDLNNNHLPDIIVVSKDFRIRAIDGNWGIEIWKSRILAGPLTGPPVVGDFNGDGFKDLAVASTENLVYIGFSGLKNSHWIQIPVEAQIRSILTASDITGDGFRNLVLGTESGKILVIDGVKQTVSEEININEELNKASGSYFQDNQIRYPIATGDLNGDTVNDLLICTLQGNLIAIDGLTLERMWYDLASDKVKFEHPTFPSIVMGDLDGDHLPDVVSLTPDGRLRAIKGVGERKDRKMLLWEIPAIETEYFVGQPVLADFNKNGTVDVVAVNNLGGLFIFEGVTGDILWKKKQSEHAIIGSPLIGDLDTDSHLDILTLRANGDFVKYTTNSLTLDGSVFWGQMFGNGRHNSRSFYKVYHTSQHYVIICLSLMVVATVMGLQIFFRKKRKKLSQIQ